MSTCLIPRLSPAFCLACTFFTGGGQYRFVDGDTLSPFSQNVSSVSPMDFKTLHGGRFMYVVCTCRNELAIAYQGLKVIVMMSYIMTKIPMDGSSLEEDEKCVDY